MVNGNHILVIRFSAMGDVAMTYPVLKSLLKQYPNLKITVLTREFFKPIFKDLPQVEVFVADLKGKHKGVLGLYKLSKELKKLKISAVADLHNVLRTNILKIFLTEYTFKQINKGRAEKKALVEGVEFEQLKPTSQRYAEVFAELGFEFGLLPRLEKRKKRLPESFAKAEIKPPRKWIGIAPFAAHAAKVYPLEQLMVTMESLAKNYDILLFGSSGREAIELEKMSHHHPRIQNLAGKLKFADELKVISNLDLMISMDSGNGHLAANFGVPVLTLWGVTHPFLGFAPHNQSLNKNLLADRKLYPKIPTSVYGNKFPNGYEKAIATIDPFDIVQSVKEMLGEA